MRSAALADERPTLHAYRFVPECPERGARFRAMIAENSGRSDADRVGLAHFSGHAARVLQVWHSDARFIGQTGQPMDLLYSGEGDTFVSLLRIAGGDVPPGAVRAELLGAGAIVELESGMLRVLKRHFVPGDLDEKLVFGLTHILFPVLEGLSRKHQASDHGALGATTGLLKTIAAFGDAAFQAYRTREIRCVCPVHR